MYYRTLIMISVSNTVSELAFLYTPAEESSFSMTMMMIPNMPMTRA